MVSINGADASGVKFHLISLQEATPECSTTVGSAGVNLVGHRLTFDHVVSGFYVEAPRAKPGSFIAAAVESLGRIYESDMSDVRVTLTHSLEVT